MDRGGMLTGLCNPKACTMVMAMKVPGGIGSLAHDSSVGPANQYFHMSFLGTTRQYLNITQKAGVEPEDVEIAISPDPDPALLAPGVAERRLTCSEVVCTASITFPSICAPSR